MELKVSREVSHSDTINEVVRAYQNVSLTLSLCTFTFHGEVDDVRPNLVIELTEHAKAQIIERKINLQWITEAIVNPIHSEPDKNYPELTCTYGKIKDYAREEDRVFKVVYNRNTTPWKIITCYFDRTAKRKFLC